MTFLAISRPTTPHDLVTPHGRVTPHDLVTPHDRVIPHGRVTTGNAEILNRAAPIGISSSVSSGMLTATGLIGNIPQSPY
jgi:hypothetical protein